VDLATLFPRQRHRTDRYHPFGVVDDKVVEGPPALLGNLRAGPLVGRLVTYPIAYGSEQKAVTYWIPAWVLKKKPSAW
jgi:hypothetical protein